MRGLVVLIAAAACAQDNRGFVNPSLATRNFVKNSLEMKAPAQAVAVPPKTPSPGCAIPLLRVPTSKATDAMVVPVPKDTGDEKMILPTIPVCPAK